MFVPFIKTFCELRQFIACVRIINPKLLDSVVSIDCYEQLNGARLELDEKNGWHFVSVCPKNEKTHTWKDIENMLSTVDGDPMRIKVDGDTHLKCVYYTDPQIEHINDMQERAKNYRVVDGAFVVCYSDMVDDKSTDMPVFMMPVEEAYNS
jgi:hypothetical protein